MPPETSGTTFGFRSRNMANWWRRDEKLALLQAWEQTLPAPRDREVLSDQEKNAIWGRFAALKPRDTPDRDFQDVEAQRQRLLRTFQFLHAFNAESARAGRPSWFQQPSQTQEALLRINGGAMDLAPLEPDEFAELERVCTAVATPVPVQMVQSKPPQDEMKAAAEALAGLPMFRPNAAVPTLSPSLSPQSSPMHRSVQESKRDESDSESVSASLSEGDSDTDDPRLRKDSDVDYVPKGKFKPKGSSKWAKRDERCLLQAWHEVVTNLARTEKPGAFASRNEALRLNSLVHERFVELCKGRTPRTNQSTGAKKHAMMTAFRFLRSLLRELASLSDRPNWFGMTPEERLELQKLHGHHQENACVIEKETYQQLAEIDRATRIVTTPDENSSNTVSRQANTAAIGDMRRKWGKSSGASGRVTPAGRSKRSSMTSSDSDESSSSEEPVARTGPSPASRGGRISPADRTNRARKDAPRRDSRDAPNRVDGGRAQKRRRTGLSDPKWVTRLLDAQTQRFESLLAEFREERRQEREHNVEIIVEALKLRSASAKKPDQPTPFVEGLVEKQRQNMLALFNQLQEEQSKEREQARKLLRELGGANLVSSQDSEAKE